MKTSENSNPKEFIGYTMKLGNLQNKKLNKRDKKCKSLCINNLVNTYKEDSEMADTPEHKSTHQKGNREKHAEYAHQPPSKRLKIERMFEDLTLNDLSTHNVSSKTFADNFQNSQCFSIEIHKVLNYDSATEGDVLPRKRKVRKSSNSTGSGNTQASSNLGDTCKPD